MSHLIFQSEILINAPQSKVWELVATENGLRQWWGNTIHLEAKEGGQCEEWRAQGERVAHWSGAVTLYAPPSQLMLYLRAIGTLAEEPQLSTIHITLQPEGSQTRVYVTHRAFAATSTLAPERPRAIPTLPHAPHSTPMAQLKQPAPGSAPVPTSRAQDLVEPDRRLVTQHGTDRITAMWQARFTGLAACATQG